MIGRESMFIGEELTKSDRCLHTPGSFARQNLLYVQEAGTLESLQPHRCVRERLDSFLILIVAEGKGILQIRDQQIELHAGQGAWIDCMEHYEHISDADEAWKLAWVHFNGNTARSFYEIFRRYNADRSEFSLCDPTDEIRTIQSLREVQKEKGVLAEITSGELLLHLLNGILGTAAESAVAGHEQEKQTAEKIRVYINDHYNDKSIVKDLMAEYDLSLSEMNLLFEQNYHIGLEEYISNRRYNAAKELLRFSVKPVEAILEETGIGDMLVLQQMFRENDGMTAEEYRRKWAGWIRN